MKPSKDGASPKGAGANKYDFPLQGDVGAGEHSLVNESSFVTAFRSLGVSLLQAFCEIVDNSLDASAKKIAIETKKVSDDCWVLFADDGAGMPPEKMGWALQIGNRLNRNTGAIGRFGWGLKAASASQADRVEVFSKTAKSGWMWTVIDFGEIEKGIRKGFPSPAPCAEPAEFPFKGAESGTLVLWKGTSNMDPNTPVELQSRLAAEFGRIYRKFLAAPGDTENRKRIAVQLTFDGKKIEPADPLYLTPGARDWEKIGPGEEFFTIAPLKFKNPKTGVEGLIRFRFAWLDRVKVEMAALELVNELNQRADRDAKKGTRIRRVTVDDIKGRWKINSEGQGFSVLRENREIDWGQTLNNVIGKRPDSNYFRAEIMFDPELDEAFGINMNKSRFWIHTKLRAALKTHLAGLKGQIEAQRAKHASALEAFKAELRESELIAGDAEREFRRSKETKDSNVELDAEIEKAEAEARDGKRSKKDVAGFRARLNAARKKSLPFVLDFSDKTPGAPFYRPVYKGMTSIVYLNTASAFYREVYEPAKETSWGKLIELFILGISRAEIEEQKCDEDGPRTRWYSEMRKDWTTYLEAYLVRTGDGHKAGEEARLATSLETEASAAETPE